MLSCVEVVQTIIKVLKLINRHPVRFFQTHFIPNKTFAKPILLKTETPFLKTGLYSTTSGEKLYRVALKMLCLLKMDMVLIYQYLWSDNNIHNVHYFRNARGMADCRVLGDWSRQPEFSWVKVLRWSDPSTTSASNIYTASPDISFLWHLLLKWHEKTLMPMPLNDTWNQKNAKWRVIHPQSSFKDALSYYKPIVCP